MQFELSKHPHRRYNPLKDEWILVSPHRMSRPWTGQVEKPSQDSLVPRHDPNNPLSPGAVRSNGSKNPDYKTTYIFDNDFPALLFEGPAPEKNEDDLFKVEAAHGSCKVMCFHPFSDLSLATMDLQQIQTVIDSWIDLMRRLSPDFAWVQIFENKGAAMGCSNPHPHCQVWSSSFLPQEVSVKDINQRKYFEKYGRPLLCDYLSKELKKNERIILETDHWVALVPFWAVWPFESMLMPKKHTLRLQDLSKDQRDDLALAIKTLLVKYDNLFETSFPYSMGWHQAPTGSRLEGGSEEHWQLHALYFPPLLRSATVKKFMVGYEMLANAQRDITAEEAARRLSCLPNEHYLSKKKL